MRLILVITALSLLAGCASLGFESHSNGQARWDHYTRDSTGKWSGGGP